MRRWLINVAKNETILIVAAILALISCFIVPPDADYKSYIPVSYTHLTLPTILLV